MRRLSRLVTFVCALALVAQASAPCAGWQAAAEARVDCCASHCPMDAEASHHGTPEPVSQAGADACCTISGRSDATPVAAPAPAASMALVPLASPVAAHVHIARDTWRPAAPVPIRSIPTHLLLSVLLV